MAVKRRKRTKLPTFCIKGIKNEKKLGLLIIEYVVYVYIYKNVLLEHASFPLYFLFPLRKIRIVFSYGAQNTRKQFAVILLFTSQLGRQQPELLREKGTTN